MFDFLVCLFTFVLMNLNFFKNTKIPKTFKMDYGCRNCNDPEIIKMREAIMNPQRVQSQASTNSDIGVEAYSERTLAIIKPEAFDDSAAIENTITNNGFAILARRIVHLTAEQAAEFYKGHYGNLYFPHLVAHMSQGPIIAIVLAGHDCIKKFRTLMGPAKVAEAQAYWPESLRACYGRRTPYGDYFNAIHGSESQAEALREIHFFFPTMVVGPLLRSWQITDYITKHVSPTLIPALNALAAERPEEPILWLAEELLKNNPNEPEQYPKYDDLDDPRCHTPESVDSEANLAEKKISAQNVKV